VSWGAVVRSDDYKNVYDFDHDNNREMATVIIVCPSSFMADHIHHKGGERTMTAILCL
jgi:hypothetical protein